MVALLTSRIKAQMGLPAQHIGFKGVDDGAEEKFVVGIVGESVGSTVVNLGTRDE